jgi:hypothetical protein
LYAVAKLSGKFKLISLIPLTFSEGFIPIIFSKFALLVTRSFCEEINAAIAPANEASDCAKSVKFISPFSSLF